MPDIKIGNQSWEALAKKYGVTVSQLKQANPGIKILQSGMVVRVPSTTKQNNYSLAGRVDPRYSNLTSEQIAYNRQTDWQNDPALKWIPAVGQAIGNFFNPPQSPTLPGWQQAGLTYNQAKSAMASSLNYQAQSNAYNQSQYQNNNPNYRGDDFLFPTPKYYKPPAAPMTVVQRANAYAQQQAQSQANYNARYNTGASALLEGGITTKINNTPFTYYTQGNVAVNQNTGGLVSMKPQTPQNTNVPKPLNYYLTDAQIAKQAARRRQARNQAQVDTTPYFGTTNAMTWKYNG